jgi:hypothetical protein
LYCKRRCESDWHWVDHVIMRTRAKHRRGIATETHISVRVEVGHTDELLDLDKLSMRSARGNGDTLERDLPNTQQRRTIWWGKCVSIHCNTTTHSAIIRVSKISTFVSQLREMLNSPPPFLPSVSNIVVYSPYHVPKLVTCLLAAIRRYKETWYQKYSNSLCSDQSLSLLLPLLQV